MLLIAILLVVYLALGVALDVLLHANSPIVYWDTQDAVVGHVATVLLWPLALLTFVRGR